MNLIKRQENLIPSVWDNFIENSLFTHSVNGHADKTTPAVNLSEDNDNYHIELAAPGLSKDKFNVELVKNKLTISADQTEEKKEEGKNYTRIEYGFSSFTRTFTLPQTADLNKINATYTDGILHLTVAKKEEAKENTNRLIEIK